jgi:dynein intermediate chain 2, axonemal
MCRFHDTGSDTLWEIPPSVDLFEEYVEKNPCSTTVQAIPVCSEHEVKPFHRPSLTLREINTERFELLSHGMTHMEGGWPKDVDSAEPEQTIRYRKKIEKDEDYLKSIRNLGESVERFLKQNGAIDIYEEYFSGSLPDLESEPPSAKTLTVFRDPNSPKRVVTSISWYPDGAKKVAVSYAVLKFQGQPDGMSMNSYIWDVTNPNFPELELTPASPLVCLEYNPKDTHILLGGCYNGLLQYWDDRKGSTAVDSSPIEKSHRDPVYEVCWLQSKTGTECASVSTDGQICWWDIRYHPPPPPHVLTQGRKLGEPMETLLLDPKGDNVVLGGVTLEYEVSAGVSSKYAASPF